MKNGRKIINATEPEMLVKVFRKIEEEGVIWPKIKELIAIRESLDFSKYTEEEEVIPGAE